MATKITMPKLSDTMVEGVLLKWLKKEGELIEAGEVIAEAESDKATMELEAFDAGVLKKIIVPEGGKVPVGGTLALIADEDEDISDLLEEVKKIPQPKVEKEQVLPAVEGEIHAAPVIDKTPADVILTSDTVRIKASPLARKLASEHDIDLRRITASGTGGRIIKRDVEHFIAEAPKALAAAPTVGKEIILNTMRSTIASRMTKSKTTVPHFYLTMQVNMNNAVEFRTSLNKVQKDVKISYNDMIIKACALALKKHPYVNGSFQGDKIVLHDRIDVGVAVALNDGLITPVVRNADQKSLGQMALEIRDLAVRAKKRKLLPQDYTNGTFTISNLGMYEIDEFSAIINAPEAAILAVGGVMQVPVVEDGEIVIGHRMKVTLSCDHRIVDGATGALFLKEIKRLLENPLGLML
ncbi:MAG: 2-oxo acid dehydrogenase subunit E2 [Calditrichaeota bacterium]|nr:2-oxo acid dehydrogenase subunit E2 [Calditrichota bacterium]